MTPASAPSRRGALAALVLALALVLAGTALRIGLAFADPRFDRVHAERMLKSDPALLHHLVSRIVEARGRLPDDVRADPRIEHPEPFDVVAMLPLVQERLLAFSALVAGPAVPLHVVAMMTSAITASFVALFVFLLARELGTGPGLALCAAALWAASAAAYRTIGIGLLNEDVALPLFAAHLWLLARAARTQRTADALGCSLVLALALASWHALGFFVALEALALAVAWLATGRSLFASRPALAGLALVALAALVQPFLWRTRFLLSPALQIAAGLALAGALERRGVARGARTLAGLGLVLSLATLALALGQAGVAGFGEYSHVFGLLVAKLRFLGERPLDPGLVAPEVRLMWQGPFETASLREHFSGFPVGAVLLLPIAFELARRARAGCADAREIALAALALLGCAAAWAIQRVLVLPALVLPVLVALALARFEPSLRRAWAAGLVVTQLAIFGAVMQVRESRWWVPEQQDALAAASEAVRRLVPEGEAIVGDCVTSAALLATTGRPIVVQPKWEHARARQRNVDFLRVLFHEPPEAMRDFLRRYDARWLIVDREELWRLRWTAGLPLALQDPVPGTAAAGLLARDATALARVPGFRLRWSDPGPTHRLWLYELD